MVFLVPFDGSRIARTALDRAVEYGAALDSDVVAIAYVPTGDSYAERRRRIDPTDDFAADSAASDLRRKIEEATDETELRFDDAGAQSPAGTLSAEVRRAAADLDASVVFVASRDDRLVIPLGDIDGDYDIHVVGD